MGEYSSYQGRNKNFVSWFLCCNAICSLDIPCSIPEPCLRVMECHVGQGQAQVIHHCTPYSIDSDVILLVSGFKRRTYICDEECIFAHDGDVIRSENNVITGIERAFISHNTTTDSMMKPFNHRARSTMIDRVDKNAPRRQLQNIKS